MGLTTAMYTGLSGLNVNQTRIANIGNNIANVNTTGYKNARTNFQTQFSQTLTMGSPPSTTSGGTNPTQLGLGSVVGSVQRLFTPGNVETTGVPSDLAIQGDGLFIIRRPDGQQAYTRDGAFALSSDNRLVTMDGNFVRGFGVDQNFQIIPTVLQDLQIPLGTLTLARATENVTLDGDLSAAGDPATISSEHVTQALVNGSGAAADANTALIDLRSADQPGQILFADGDGITVNRVTKGERELPARTFVVGVDGNTLGDFASWLNGALGIQTATGLPGTPGATVENGTLVIRGNTGEQNSLDFSANDVLSSNATSPLPFQFTENAESNGSSVFTAFTVYDSLGAPLIVNATFALESATDTGPVWRYYLESPDATGGTRALGTGTITFDVDGNYVGSTGNPITLDHTGSGATTPVTFALDFAGLRGLSTELSNVILADQDGYPPGTLATYAVGPDGVITGTFDNGMNQTLGQVALATFPNPAGLVATTDNLYLLGPNAGQPTVTPPGQFGAGTILSQALELSNVDLSNEFIGLITSSTGFQAASRVISVSSELLDQLLLVVR